MRGVFGCHGGAGGMWTEYSVFGEPGGQKGLFFSSRRSFLRFLYGEPIDDKRVA